MEHHDSNECAPASSRRVLQSATALGVLVFLILWWPAAAQSDTAPVPEQAPLTAEQVVENLTQMNRQRFQALHAYQGRRTYHLDYRGFPGARSADMVVSVKYLSPATKEFVVVSASGSKLLIDRVFKKLLEAEQEAFTAEMQRHSALNSENYSFTMDGYERTPSGALYVLKVVPRTKDKFLYRGRIWVDAADFAVVRLEAEPAKNPSFWTKKAEIVQVYKKVDDFWLPASNHSVSSIRLGGHADLTIDYEDYAITDATRVSSLPTHPVRTANVQTPP
jgi:hypothetical protein